MTAQRSVADFCRYILDNEKLDMPMIPCVWERFSENTPEFRALRVIKNIYMVRSLGIKIQDVHYLKSGGTNMTANGLWYIHYSAKDRPPTQKFNIFHELFEMIHKNIGLQPAMVY